MTRCWGLCSRGLIARSSRAIEPFVAPFVGAAVGASGPLKLLEVGCGSGIYLRRAAANPEVASPFDLITLYNNVYCFPVDERPALLRDLRSRLARGGRLAIVSLMQQRNVAAAAFDLILRSTVGCAPLPRLAEMKGHLGESGFGQVRTTKLAPDLPFCGLLASG